MLRINRDVEYALLALAYLGRAHPAGQEDGGASGPLSARELAVRLAAPPPLLGKILPRLARAGLVRSAHGPSGGYRLERALGRISLQEVVQALEGPVKIVPCLDEVGRCRRRGCAIRHGVGRMQRKLIRLLDSCTVQDLIAEEEVADGVAGAGV